MTFGACPDWKSEVCDSKFPLTFQMNILRTALALGDKAVCASLILLAFFSGAPSSQTYYVDAVKGDDSRAGTGPRQAWKTIAKVNGHSFANGTAILLKRDCRWNEHLVVPGSGLKFGNYGSGRKPMLDGADVITGWVPDAGFIYKATVAHHYSVQVFQDATRLTIASSYGVMTAGSCYFNSGTTTLYVWCTDNANPSTHAIEATVNFYSDGIDFNGKDSITVDGIDEERAAIGFCFENTVGTHVVTVSNCALYDNDLRGIDFGGYNDLQVTNALLDHDSVFNCREDEGIWFGNGTEVAQYCYATGNYPDFRVGIRAVNCKYLHCTSVNPQHGSLNVEYEGGYPQPAGTVVSNCWLQGGTSDPAVENRGANTTFAYNVIIGNNTTDISAIRMYQPGINAHVYNNTIVANGSGYAIGVDSLVPGIFKNNIIVGVSGIGLLESDHSYHNPQWVSDYNDWRGTGGFQLARAHYFARTHYSTLTAWAAVVGGEVHSITSDPLFTNNYPNFHLRSGSPCIDAGTDVGLTTDFDGRSIVGVPDIGAYEYKSP